jgi:hypothetical protein
MEALRRLSLILACLSPSLLSAADVVGVWQGQLTMTGARGEQRREVTLTLALSGSRLTGTMTADGETAEILDGTVKGDEVSFAITSGADDVPRFAFNGSVVDDALTLTVSGRLKDTGQTLTFGEGSFKRRK